jgi:hypothetical protein
MVIGLFKFLRGWVPDLFLENHSNDTWREFCTVPNR